MPRWRWPTWLVVANVTYWLGLGVLLVDTPDRQIEAEREGLAVYFKTLVKIGVWAGGFALSAVAALIIWSETRPRSSTGVVRIVVALLVLGLSAISLWTATLLFGV